MIRQTFIRLTENAGMRMKPIIWPMYGMAEMTAMVNRALGRDPQSASDLLEGMKTWKDNADPTAWCYLDIQEAANGHTYARKTGGEYWTGLVADVVH